MYTIFFSEKYGKGTTNVKRRLWKSADKYWE